jgi:hypothetical protein
MFLPMAKSKANGLSKEIPLLPAFQFQSTAMPLCTYPADFQEKSVYGHPKGSAGRKAGR